MPTRHNVEFLQHRRKIGRGALCPMASRQWGTLCLAVGALVCLDWTVKMWLLWTLCAACTPTSVVHTAAPPPTLPQKRISAAGVHYGDCTAVTLAVVLFPEPCGWESATPQAFASR